MKTIAAYYDHTGPGPVAARIREIRETLRGRAVLLDATIFYPEGGGQSGDRGSINGVALRDVREEAGEIFHYIDDGAALAPGPAELRLDAARRRDFTVQHTAQHLLSGVLLSISSRPTLSMHLGDEVCTIDVDAPELSAETLSLVEDAVAAAIEADVPVITHLCPPERAADFPLRKKLPQGEAVIRVVEMGGYDCAPCCGTHLASTGGIGMLRILGAEKYKGMSRLSFIAGRRVLEDSRRLRRNGEIVSRALSVPVLDTGPAVLALLEKTARLEAQVKEFRETQAAARAGTLLREAGLLGPGAEGRVLGAVIPGADMEETLRVGRAAQKLTGAVLVLGSAAELKFAALCSAPNADVRPLVKAAMEALGGRGGGGPAFFQGRFPGEAALRTFLAGLPERLPECPLERLPVRLPERPPGDGT
jgi:alanyl-tRNA synthetase